MGQIAHSYLKYRETQGFNFTFFEKGLNKPRARRCLKRAFNDVSIPQDPNSKKVKSSLHEKVGLGEIDLGENIVEREYKKLITNDLGIVETKSFFVNAKKHSLSKLRVKLF